MDLGANARASIEASLDGQRHKLQTLVTILPAFIAEERWHE